MRIPGLIGPVASNKGEWMVHGVRTVGVVAVALAVAAGLAGCGSDTDSTSQYGVSTTASVEDYCAAVEAAGLDKVAAGDNRGYAQALARYLEGVRATGLPKDVPKEAVKGFVILTDALEGVDAAAVRKAEASGASIAESLITGDDRVAVNAYGGFESRTCADESPATG